MSEYRYFSPDTDERLFVCSETGETGIKEAFVHRLDNLRELCGFGFRITSGFRSKRHSKEMSKSTLGDHARGEGADIAVSNGIQRARIVKHAIAMGFNGIGVAKTFVHVSDRPAPLVMWTYD